MLVISHKERGFVSVKEKKRYSKKKQKKNTPIVWLVSTYAVGIEYIHITKGMN